MCGLPLEAPETDHQISQDAPMSAMGETPMRDLSIHYQPREHLRPWVRARVRRLEREGRGAFMVADDPACPPAGQLPPDRPPEGARPAEPPRSPTRWWTAMLIAAGAFVAGVIAWRIAGAGGVVASAMASAVLGWWIGEAGDAA